MFSMKRPEGRSRWWGSHGLSRGAHAKILALLAIGPPPQYVKPQLLQLGEKGSANVTYLADSAQALKLVPSENKLSFPVAQKKVAAKPAKRKLRPLKEEKTNDDK